MKSPVSHVNVIVVADARHRDRRAPTVGEDGLQALPDGGRLRGEDRDAVDGGFHAPQPTRTYVRYGRSPTAGTPATLSPYVMSSGRRRPPSYRSPSGARCRDRRRRRAAVAGRRSWIAVAGRSAPSRISPSCRVPGQRDQDLEQRRAQVVRRPRVAQERRHVGRRTCPGRSLSGALRALLARGGVRGRRRARAGRAGAPTAGRPSGRTASRLELKISGESSSPGPKSCFFGPHSPAARSSFSRSGEPAARHARSSAGSAGTPRSSAP